MRQSDSMRRINRTVRAFLPDHLVYATKIFCVRGHALSRNGLSDFLAFIVDRRVNETQRSFFVC